MKSEWTAYWHDTTDGVLIRFATGEETLIPQFAIPRLIGRPERGRVSERMDDRLKAVRIFVKLGADERASILNAIANAS